MKVKSAIQAKIKSTVTITLIVLIAVLFLNGLVKSNAKSLVTESDQKEVIKQDTLKISPNSPSYSGPIFTGGTK